MTCDICGKEVNVIASFYAKKLKGIFLPRLDVCEDCLKNRKEEVEKRKKEVLEDVQEKIKGCNNN